MLLAAPDRSSLTVSLYSSSTEGWGKDVPMKKEIPLFIVVCMLVIGVCSCTSTKEAQVELAKEAQVELIHEVDEYYDLALVRVAKLSLKIAQPYLDIGDGVRYGRRLRLLGRSGKTIGGHISNDLYDLLMSDLTASLEHWARLKLLFDGENPDDSEVFWGLLRKTSYGQIQDLRQASQDIEFISYDLIAGGPKSVEEIDKVRIEFAKVRFEMEKLLKVKKVSDH